MRNGVRTLLGRVRQRPQTLAGAALAGLMLFLLGSMISSCIDADQAPSAGAPQPIRPPGAGRSVPTIRVRLVDATGRATVAVTGGYRIAVDGAAGDEFQTGLAGTEITRTPAGFLLDGREYVGQVLTIEPTEPVSMVRLGRRTYHGRLVLRAADVAGLFSVDNHVNLERYLAGVLARELYGDWHLETYKALAVASRTYALYVIRHEGRTRSFDVYADQRSQVYGGAADETDKSRRAVRDTWGQVLVYDAGTGAEPIKAFFSSACGGVTNPAEALEPGPWEAMAPLTGGVTCEDCRFSPRWRWDPVRVDKAEVYRALGRTYRSIALFGSMRELRVAERTPWGRPVWVEVLGPGNLSDRVRADDLRLCLLRAGVAPGLYSANCNITDTGDQIVFTEGRGFGHGVGLCQYGAEGKARRGLRYFEILYSYYPGAQIKQAW